MKILIKISFDGSNYHGWQIQKNARSVFSALSDAAELSFGQPVKITGCSRTDSGVHALCFYATLESESFSVPVDALPRVLNSFLPGDIVCLDASGVPDDFHPRYSAVSKSYRYVLYTGRYRSPFYASYSYFYPLEIDANRINEACKYLIGKHDFTSFMKADDSNPEDRVRTVFSAETFRDGDLFCFDYTADGFLYNMVRIITGTLLEVSSGRIEPIQIKEILEKKDRRFAGKTAPPQGLFLTDVKYNF